MFFRIMAVCLAVEGAAAFFRWQNDGLMITRLEVVSPRLPQSLDGLKLVQVADLHNKEFGVGQSRILGMIRQERPGLILLSGDLIDKRRTTAETMEPARELLAGAAAIAPTCFVAGNHEAVVPFYPQLRRLGEEAGAVCLDGKLLRIGEGADHLAVIGLPSPLLMGEEAFARRLKELREEAGEDFTLLLSHHPEKIPLYKEAGVDLALCGHAHGGQFRLPVVGGLYAPGQGVLPRYTAGLYPLEGTGQMAVSRGLGNSRFPLRLFNRPQLLSITLRRQSDVGSSLCEGPNR